MGRENKLSGVFSLKDTNPIGFGPLLKTSFNVNYFCIKALSANTVIPGFVALKYQFWETQFSP